MNLIQEHNDETTVDNVPNPSPKWKRFLRNKIFIGIVILVCIAVAVPPLIYYFAIKPGEYPRVYEFSCSVGNTSRIPCGTSTTNVTAKYCAEIQCCFDSLIQRCYHFLPSKYYYYEPQDGADGLFQPAQAKTPFLVDSKANIAISVSEIDADNLKITLHPAETSAESAKFAGDKSYLLRDHFDKKLNVDIYRSDNKTALLSTLFGPTIVSDEHWEWTLDLSCDHLFGLGETLIKLDEATNLNKVIYGNRNEHNALPKFIARKNEQFHGIKVNSDGLLEVMVLSSNLIVLRTFKGSQIEVELQVGPSVQDVVKQQSGGVSLKDVVNEKMLGVHICREGESWDVDAMLKEYAEQDRSIAFESDCIHSNLFLSLLQGGRSLDGGTLAANLAVAMPPQIPSEFYAKFNTSIPVYLNENNTAYNGVYYREDVVYPDFEAETSDFATLLANQIKSKLSVPLNYFILYDNWPQDDSTAESDLVKLPYVSEQMYQSTLFTLPWQTTQTNNKIHLTSHNNYASLQANFVNSLAKDALILSAGHGFDSTTTNAIFIQNIPISWINFILSIKKMLFNSILGTPLISIPVCGSSPNYNKQQHELLCLRWYMMASTMPIFLISSDLPRRDPAALNTKQATIIAKEAIDIRKQFSYYIYSVFKEDAPLNTPLFYNFPHDIDGFSIDWQYMFGDAVLVAHPTNPDVRELPVYLPRAEEIDVWYEVWGGYGYHRSMAVNGTIYLDFLESDWVGFVSEGKILPMRAEINNEVYIEPIIAMFSKNNAPSSGRVWLENEKFELSFASDELTITRVGTGAINSLTNPVYLKNVIVYSIQERRQNFACNTTINFMDIVDDFVIELKKCTTILSPL